MERMEECWRGGGGSFLAKRGIPLVPLFSRQAFFFFFIWKRGKGRAFLGDRTNEQKEEYPEDRGGREGGRERERSGRVDQTRDKKRPEHVKDGRQQWGELTWERKERGEKTSKRCSVD